LKRESPRDKIAEFVSENPGCTKEELARHTGKPQSNLNGMLWRMEYQNGTLYHKQEERRNAWGGRQYFNRYYLKNNPKPKTQKAAEERTFSE